MNNFYYIDKPLNYSSFDVIRVLKKKLNIKKIGHTWTLDPLATGGLLIATWNYTKLIPFLEKAKKTYEFTINIDWYTESFDLATKINFLDKNLQEKYKKEISKEKLEKILKENFFWKITQVPPKYSAVKVNWQRAYSLARKWKEVVIKSREVEIFNIEILDYSYPKIFLRATVSAWTYIRSIARDLWKILGTWWYISFLRRTKIENLWISIAQKLEEFDRNKSLKENLLFDESLFIKLEKNILEQINNWLKVYKDFSLPKNKKLFVYNEKKITNIVEYNWVFLKPVRKI